MKIFTLAVIVMIALSGPAFSMDLETESELAIRDPNNRDGRLSVNNIDWYSSRGFSGSLYTNSSNTVKLISYEAFYASERENGFHYSENKFRITYLLPWYMIKAEFRTHLKEARDIDKQVYTLGWSTELWKQPLKFGLGISTEGYTRHAGLAADFRVPLPGDDGRLNLTWVYGSAPIWDVVTSYTMKTHSMDLPYLSKDRETTHKLVLKFVQAGKSESLSLSYKVGVKIL